MLWTELCPSKSAMLKLPNVIVLETGPLGGNEV